MADTGQYGELFQKIGLSKNGARIYETLLREGELSVGKIATKSGVHRRNVYDAIQRLLELGLVFEILESHENRYQAVEPSKLVGLVQEKEALLREVLPELEMLYAQSPAKESVCIYRGVEGWKNYMRDIVRLGEDFYCIGGKGGWMDERVMTYFPQFMREIERKEISFYHLFDYEVKASEHEIVNYVGKNYKFLPEGYSSSSSIDIFGDRVNITSQIGLGSIASDISFTVIINQEIANACRLWFQFMWDHCPDE
ncbi:hypothetical protein MRY87_03580 [bacterium]|nr:hypothetical protein [bacterium]